VTGAKLPGFQERFAQARGARLRYFVAGDGEPPVVLLHGLGGAAANWVELAPALAERHRVLAPDLPGHAGSAALPAVPTLGALADRVALLAAREGLEPAVVFGHSLGGTVAVQLALRHPERVAGLLLAAPPGISSRLRRARIVLRVAAAAQPGRRVARFHRAVARTPWLRYPVFGWWAVADPPALSARAVEGFLAGPRLHTDWASAARALVEYDVREDLGAVRCPTLLLWGARDNWVPLEDGFRYARLLRAPLRVIGGCGHLLIAERPEACLDGFAWLLDRVRQVEEGPLEPEPLGQPSR
jgi:pimeloyl-ACP methyl ester carboxylesterase